MAVGCQLPAGPRSGPRTVPSGPRPPRAMSPPQRGSKTVTASSGSGTGAGGPPRGSQLPPTPRLSAAPRLPLRCLCRDLLGARRWPPGSGTRPAANGSLRPPGAMAGSPGLKPLVAVCQLTSTPDKELNFAACAGLVREAARRGACLVFLPEGFDYIGSNTAETLSLAESLDGDLLGRYAGLARDCGVWLSLGGFHERGRDWPTTQRIYNCHVLLDPAGCRVAAYRKTHLCDVELEGRVTMKESSFTNPGPEIVPPVSTPAGKLGLSICYDLRFPEISLALRRAGAEILTYPSAFTVTTGSAHWEVLLRARAIESQCYVVAAAQTGKNHERRTSYGHSLVVDPWGSVVAQCREGPGLCYAEIDLDYLHRVRREIPVHSHRRPDLYGTVAAAGAPAP